MGDHLSKYYQCVLSGAIVNWDCVESAFVDPGLTGFDPSYFIREVPEPSIVILLGMAAMMLGRRGARRG